MLQRSTIEIMTPESLKANKYNSNWNNTINFRLSIKSSHFIHSFIHSNAIEFNPSAIHESTIKNIYLKTIEIAIGNLLSIYKIHSKSEWKLNFLWFGCGKEVYVRLVEKDIHSFHHGLLTIQIQLCLFVYYIMKSFVLFHFIDSMRHFPT